MFRQLLLRYRKVVGHQPLGFDRGIFTISDEYEIVVNPKAKQAAHDRFPVLEMQGEKITLPEDEGL